MPKESPAPRPDPEEELRRHIQALGLQSVEEYRSWCAQHGFTRKLAKGPTARGRELAVVQQQRATRHATQQARKQREFRHAADVARGICDGGLAESDVSSVHLQRFAKLVSTWFGGPARGVAERRALGRLIAHAQRERAKFFEPPQSLPPQPGAPATFLDALVVIAFHHRDWRRPLEEWESRSHSPSRQFASLLRHLFVQYDMPLFFDAVWFGSHDHAAAVRRAWYLHVGRGENIRNCALPIPYTKRMAHHFLRAPDNATIEQAIRWGQVLGLGGDEHLARTLFGTRLGERFENEEFWETVIRWFILHPMLDRDQLGPIIDYLQHQRFVPLVGARPGDAPAPQQPLLTMKGRSPQTLLRHVEQWHRGLARGNRVQIREWAASGYAGLNYSEGMADRDSFRRWTIRELVSGSALLAEGRQMKHCVATYAASCARGMASIWTLEVESRDGCEKLLTIEVRNSARLICQARGRMNRMPTQRELNLLHRWAATAGLSVSNYLE